MSFENTHHRQREDRRQPWDRERLRPWMDMAFISSFIVQLLASLVWFAGLVWMAVSRASLSSVWLTGASITVVLLCILVRRYVQRWFRRQWPIKCRCKTI